MNRRACLVVACVALISVVILGGCGGGTATITLNFPGGTNLAIDQGQNVTINVTVTNDSSNSGVTWSCSGTACTTLANVGTTSVTFDGTVTGTATITATSAKNTSISKSVTITVNGDPTITTTQTQLNGTAAVAGQSYSFSFTETGGSGTLTWSATGLSDGLSINSSTGAITGTPTSHGTVSFTVTVKDSSAAGDESFTTATVTITVSNPPAPTITTTQAQVTAAAATAGTAYSFTFHASGTGTLTWNATGLPADGLSLNASTGVVSGTPTSAAAVNFTLTVSDTYGQSSTATLFTITVSNPPAPTITTTQAQVTAAPATVGTAYSFTFHGTGTGTLTWSATGLPADGLSLNTSTGVVSGTPTSHTTVAFTLTLSDTFGQSSSPTAFTITVNNPAPPVITTTPAQVPSATVNVAYNFTLQGSGYGTLTWSTTPPLSDGLSLNPSTGAITGTPTSATTLNFSVTLTDGLGQQTTVNGFSIVVSTESIAFTGTVPTSVTEGGSFSINATVSNDTGNGGVDWTVTCGSAQCGSFTASHTASGTATTYDAPATPPTGGTVTITATAHDAPNPQVSAVVTVNFATLTITTSSLPNGTVNTSYNATITASGGEPPYTFSLDSGSAALPNGLQFNPGSPSATITGTPTATGTTNNIIIDVKDSEGTPMTTSMTYSITINSVSASCNSGSESLLNGQYAFLLQGFDTNGAVNVIGSFTANGSGGITAGEEDINNSTTANTPPVLSIISASSSYSVGQDTNGGYRGCMTIATSAGTSTYRFILNRIGENTANVAGNGRMTEFDSTGVLVSGVMRQQTASAFSNTAVTGNFAFGLVSTEELTTQGEKRQAIAGTFTVSGTSITAGDADVDESGTVDCSPCTFTGTRGTPDANGRDTFTLVPTGQSGIDLVYYTVSASELLLMCDDAQSNNGVFAGTVLQQSGRPFSNSSLNATTVVSVSGEGVSGTADVQVGLLTFPSSGNYAYNTDENNGGTIDTVSDSGTYSVGSNGRVIVSSGGGGHNPILYLVSANEGFIVGTDNSATAGFFEPQAAGPFSVAGAAGVYGFGTTQPVEQNVDYQDGWVNFNGSGGASGAVDEVDLSDGQQPNQTLTNGGYTLASNGRGTFFASGGSSTPLSIFYAVSATKGYSITAYSDSGNPKSDPSITVNEK